jgi:hypothetical protein
MSFINSLSSGEKGIRGARGETGSRGIIGITGNTGAKGDQGAAGTDGTDGTDGNNAGDNPTFTSVDVETIDCEYFKNNGNNILQSTTISLNNGWSDIYGIGNRFTGLVVLTPEDDNLSCGTFAVSNSSSTNNSGMVNELSVQGDFYDSNKRIRLDYVGGELKATKDNEGGYQRYNVSYFGFH